MTPLFQVASVAQHILALEPEKDAARLCFLQYLGHLCEANETVNTELLWRFFFRALVFPHWQAHKAHLFNEVAALLQHYQDTHQIALPIDASLFSEDMQVVSLESQRNLELIVDNYLRKTVGPYDQCRVLREGNERVVAIVLQGDRSLRATIFPRVAMIREGELLPLCHDYTVYYTPELHIHPSMIQSIEIGPHTSARFRSTPEGIYGSIVRGYTFQRFMELDGGSLHRYPMIFYPLKRLEQFFVNRKSDPMYIELTNLLEKALELMSQRHPEALKFGQAAMERGRLALEHIFPDDKLVRLLINNLEKTLALAAMTQGTGPVPLSQAPASLVSEQEDLAPEGTYLISSDSVDTTEQKEDTWPTIRNLPV